MVAGNITTGVNKGRWAWGANERSTYLDIYALEPLSQENCLFYNSGVVNNDRKVWPQVIYLIDT